MTRQQAQQAVDDAMADGVKKAFGVLVLAFIGSDIGHEEALKRFETGLAIHDEAHSKATAAVERIFPE